MATNYTVSITNNQVFQSLWDWLTLILPTETEIIRGDDNRVPQPGDSAVVMHNISSTRLATNETDYTDDIINDVHQEDQGSFIDYAVQLDIYGNAAAESSQGIATLFRSSFACDFFQATGIQPLYADDPKYMPIVNGEEQYEQRWITTIHLEINPVVAAPAEFMDAASVSLVDVDATYTP